MQTCIKLIFGDLVKIEQIKEIKAELLANKQVAVGDRLFRLDGFDTWVI